MILTNKKLFVSIILLAAALLISYTLVAQAISKEEIAYPVAELGNCKDEQSCKSYCDKPDNYSQCFAFAKKNNLLEGPLADKDADELQEFAKVLKKGGPGGCKDQISCESYCNDISNMDTCLAFAEKHNLVKNEDLQEMRKVKQAIDKGAIPPGGCKNKDQCESYCQDASHIKECIAFAETAGFMPPEELARAKKAMEFMAKGETPGGCRGEKECKAYCDDESHFNDCIAFAEKAGFMSSEELAMAKKTGGKGPGGCRGRECENFCNQDGNIEVCTNFAVEHGLMSPEEAEIGRKTGGKGPGNCRGRDQCENFCKDQANQEVCFKFASDHGLVREEDKQRIEEGKQKMREGFTQAPPEVTNCLKSSLGNDFANKIQSGEAMPSEQLGSTMRKCFEQFSPKQKDGEFENGLMPRSDSIEFKGTTGPGGCKSPEECRTYCQGNPTACEGFGGGPQDSKMRPPMQNENRDAEKNSLHPQMTPQKGIFQQERNDQYRKEFERQGGQIPPESEHPQQFNREFPRSGGTVQPPQQFQQNQPTNIPPGFPTSPEQFREQNPETFNKIEREQNQFQPQPAPTPAPTSYYPSLSEFLLGLILNLLP